MKRKYLMKYYCLYNNILKKDYNLKYFWIILIYFNNPNILKKNINIFKIYYFAVIYFNNININESGRFCQ